MDCSQVECRLTWDLPSSPDTQRCILKATMGSPLQVVFLGI